MACLLHVMSFIKPGLCSGSRLLIRLNTIYIYVRILHVQDPATPPTSTGTNSRAREEEEEARHGRVRRRRARWRQAKRWVNSKHSAVRETTAGRVEDCTFHVGLIRGSLPLYSPIHRYTMLWPYSNGLWHELFRARINQS